MSDNIKSNNSDSQTNSNPGLTGQYDFKTNEVEILKYWEENGLYESPILPIRKGNHEVVEGSKSSSISTLDQGKQSDRDDYWTLVCPPPNAYDRPHMGNLSGYVYMDLMARYQRMRGKKVIMLPGKDHAGLEGEAVFIRDQLTPQGKKKSDFTRDEFYNLLYAQQQEFIKHIQKDEKLVGLSADFSKDLYTLDPKVVEKVLQTFVDAFDKGLIYKGTRIVNWDPAAQSAVSDSQCEREERDGKLYYIKYELVEQLQIPKREYVDENAKKDNYHTFYQNSLNDSRCGHCCLKIVLDRLNPELSSKYPTIQDLDVELDYNENEESGNPLRSAYFMNKMGFEVIIIDPMDYKRAINEGEKYYKEFYGQEVLDYMKKSDVYNKVFAFNKTIYESGIQISSDNSIGKLKQYLDQGYQLICNINLKIIGDTKESIIHSVLVDEINEDYVLVQDPGLPGIQNRKIERSLFDKSFGKTGDAYCYRNRSLTIRKATYEDGKDVFHISVEGFEDNFVDESIGVTLDIVHNKLGMRFDNEEKIKEYSEMNVDTKHDFYVAEIDKQVVGWVSCEFMNDLYWIDIYVRRGFRDQGIGQKLLNYILDKHQDKLLRLSVPQKSKAVEFYKRNGFIEYSRNKTTDLENPKYPMMIEMRWTKKPYIEVATTRPETIFADTAVAVHPDDPRYKHLIGKKVKLPGLDREVPIITSKRVEIDFGTGCLKITPAHAQDDYTIMEEWNKEVETHCNESLQKIGYINCIDKYAQICGPAPEKYFGKKAKVVKEEFTKELEELGLLSKTEDIKQNILKSERTGAVIEQIISSQWFIKVDNLKAELKELINSGKLTLHPHDAQNKLFAWIDNLKDWAISRSLWWGYRLPVWYKGEKVETIDENGQVQLKLKIKNEGLKKDYRDWKLNFYDDDIVNRIIEGSKTIESRVLNPEEPERYFGDMKPGDKIIGIKKLDGNKVVFEKRIKEVRIYKDIKNEWEDIEWEKLSKNGKPKAFDEMVTEWNEFYAGYGDKLETNGLVAIYLEDWNDYYLVDLDFSNKDLVRVQIENPNLQDPSFQEGGFREAEDGRLDKNNPQSYYIRQFSRRKHLYNPDNYPLDYSSNLPYNPKLTDLASENRKNMNKPEAGVWSLLKNDKYGVDFHRQKIIGNYIVDFFCNELDLVIEVDGESHDQKSDYDQARDVYLEKQGLKVIHIFTSDIWSNLENIDIYLSNLINERKTNLQSLRDSFLKGSITELHGSISKPSISLHSTASPKDSSNYEEAPSIWHQDEEVLDTWFSSGQWPYLQLSTWEMMDLYPIDCLVSGGDLLIKWDLIMMIMSLIKNLGTPFKNLYLTGMVLGKDGNKMSKSKKNGIPIESVVESFGIDSFRMNCIFKVAPFSSYIISEQTLKGFRNFNNKIWNAAKFVNEFCKIDNEQEFIELNNSEDIQMKEKLEELKKHYIDMMDNYKFWIISEEVYLSFWNEFCDKYIEIVKKRVGEFREISGDETPSASQSSAASPRKQYIRYEIQDAAEARANINYIFKEYLKLLHPFIPFVTERIWKEMGGKEMLVRNLIK